MHPDDIVRLSDASNPQEAHVLRQALEEEGIRAQVVGGRTTSRPSGRPRSNSPFGGANHDHRLRLEPAR